jgi:vitamin B12 transporter
MNQRFALLLPIWLLAPHLALCPEPIAGQQVPPSQQEQEEREDIFSLEGLIVTASPTPRSAEALASHVTVLDGDELRERGIVEVAQALRSIAGLDVARNGSYGATTSVFLRGGESDYTLVLVDGVQVNQPGGSFDFASLTTENVERIEVVRGPASALYGSDAVTGVIHVITTAGRTPPRGEVTVRAGSFGRRDWLAHYAAGTARAGYSVSLARMATDGVLAFNNGHVNTVLSGSGRLLPDDRTRLDFALRVSDREYHFPTDGSGAVVDRNAFTFGEETTAHVGVARRIAPALDLQALLGVSQSDGGTDDQADGPADTLGFYGFNSLDHFRRATGEVRAHLELGRAVVTGGFEHEEERQRSFTESLTEFGPSTGRSESERRNRAYFLHATGEAGALAFNAGGRLEDNDRFGGSATWQAGLAWRAPQTLGTRLRAAAGSAIKEPTFFENFATGFARGNPALEPERSVSWEMGLEQALLSERVRLEATYFQQRFEQIIQYTAVTASPSDPSFFNVAAASARGLEAAAGVSLGDFRGGATWTWLDTEVTDAGFDDGPGATFVEGRPLLRRPARSATVEAAVLVGSSGRVGAQVSVVGSRADRDFTAFPARPVELPAYALLAASAEWSPFEAGDGMPGLTLTARADNLLHERYEEVFGFRAPGRSLQLGASLRFGG